MSNTKALRLALHQVCVTAVSGEIAETDCHTHLTKHLSSNPTHLLVSSFASNVQPLIQQQGDPVYEYLVQVLARYSDSGSESAAADFIDDVGDQVVNTLIQHQYGDAWDTLDFGPSKPNRPVTLGQHTYMIRTIHVKLKI